MDARELDLWIPQPSLTITHRVESAAPPARLWSTARELRLGDTGLLGRLVRWRIPGVAPSASFESLFSSPPFLVLAQEELSLISGIVGRIWTLRRDYPRLEQPDAFRAWERPGTVRVAFAHWAELRGEDGGALRSETRVQAFGLQGRLGLASVRPLIRRFQQLIATEALAAAARAAER